MREIKFRAWFQTSKRMIHTLGYQWNQDSQQIGFDITNGFRPEESEEWTLMQFTGLKDKNKIDICEGDILKNHVGTILPVRWHQDLCAFDCRDDNDYDNYILLTNDTLEVIGNIYENPELLNN